MEKGKEYPKDTVKQTSEFEERQKIMRIAGEVVERILKDETIKAFKKAGYDEKDGYFSMVAASFDDSNEPQEIGKGTQENKINLKIAKTKKANPATVTPVAYLQKELIEGTKRLISEVQMDVNGNNLNITYKNTEAAAFFPKSDGPTYKANKLDSKTTFTNISDSKKFEKELRAFFSEICEEEVRYVTGSKIGIQDKIEKKMTDSIVQEIRDKKFIMSITEIVKGTSENIAKKISEGSSKKDVQTGDIKVGGTPDTPSGEPTNKEVLLGSKDDDKDTKEEKVDEITTTTPGGVAVIGGGSEGDPANSRPDTEAGDYMYASKDIFNEKAKVDDGYPQVVADENNQPKKEYMSSKLQEKFDRTPYGEALKGRAHMIKENANSGWVVVPMEPGDQNLNVPKGMKKNYTVGAPGGPWTKDAPVNSAEELKQTGHGNMSKLEKKEENVEKSEKQKLKEVFNNVRRPGAAVINEGGINKRYIIDEVPTQKQLNERWKQLIEIKSFDNISETPPPVTSTVSREEGENKNNKEFEGLNVETSLSSVPGCGEEEGMVDVPKDSTGIVIHRFKKTELNENKAYLIDKYTGKLVSNPLFKLNENNSEKKEVLDFSIYGKKLNNLKG